MAYESGNTILDDEYNTFANSSSSPFGINHIIGTGSGTLGLGQTTISTVAAGDTVSAGQWNSLFTQMDNLAGHTGDTITSTAQRSAGDQIAVISALQTDLATLATSVQGGCTGTSALTASSTLHTSSSSTRWAGSHTTEHSFTFASADALRHFFNAGGNLQIDFNRAGNGGSSATSKDTSFDELITGIGTFKFRSVDSVRSGSTETVTTNGLNIGAHDLTTSYQTVIRLTQDSGTYTSNYIDIQAKADAAAGSATVITLRAQLVDADTGDGTFTAGNTSGVDANANFVGQTQVLIKTNNPNTTGGLGTAPAAPTTAVVSNTTA